MRIASCLFALLLAACSTSAEPLPEPCVPGQDACPVTHEFGAYSIDGGKEIDGVCMSWTLNNDDPLWINAVATENDGFFHHSNWFFVPEDRYDVPEGHWLCQDFGFNEQSAALDGGVLYAQSTQTRVEEQRFVPGAALRIPPRSRIIAYTHLLNPTAEAQESEIRVRLETLPDHEVTTVLTPFRLNYTDLAIPPRSTAEFTGSCVVRDVYEALMKRPFELRLHWVLPHFHSLGADFRLTQVGGERDGEVLFDLDNAYGEPLGHRYDEPLDVAADGGTGVAFACGYENDRDSEVGYGIGDQEMCVMLGFAESAFLFDGYVKQTDAITTAGGVARGSGTCEVLGVPYQHAL